jgi:3,4-dihydroxy 2-butanone 4-phosphate synthase/GTP cyclohydrolase II
MPRIDSLTRRGEFVRMPPSLPPPFDSVESAVADIAAGRMVIVTDDEKRENEGDLIMAACKATTEAIGIMIRHGSGIVCVATTGDVLARLGLAPMVANNRDRNRTDFAVSVDASSGVTTGISAADRVRTIGLIGDANSKPEDLARPGHVFPLRSRPGGVLERPGHTEAAVDLSVLAGLHPSGVLCELMNDDGTVSRMPDIIEFKKRFGLRMVSIEALVAHRTKSCCG